MKENKENEEHPELLGRKDHVVPKETKETQVILEKEDLKEKKDVKEQSDVKDLKEKMDVRGHKDL